MNILMDDPATEKIFQEILGKIRLRMNGETVALMKSLGLNYKVNWGASVISLRELAKQYEKNHLLALKLWNKQWRETMILVITSYSIHYTKLYDSNPRYPEGYNRFRVCPVRPLRQLSFCLLSKIIKKIGQHKSFSGKSLLTFKDFLPVTVI